MADPKDEDEKTEDDESDTKAESEIKTRQKQFLEERFSTIKPKTQVEAPANVAKESEFNESSTLIENSYQDLIKQYRKCQKHKIEDDCHLHENTNGDVNSKKQKND